MLYYFTYQTYQSFIKRFLKSFTTIIVCTIYSGNSHSTLGNEVKKDIYDLEFPPELARYLWPKLIPNRSNDPIIIRNVPPEIREQLTKTVNQPLTVRPQAPKQMSLSLMIVPISDVLIDKKKTTLSKENSSKEPQGDQASPSNVPPSNEEKPQKKASKEKTTEYKVQSFMKNGQGRTVVLTQHTATVQTRYGSGLATKVTFLLQFKESLPNIELEVQKEKQATLEVISKLS